MEEISPSIMGLDLSGCQKVKNDNHSGTVTFQRIGRERRGFETYFAQDENGNGRFKVMVIPHSVTNIQVLLIFPVLNTVEKLRRYMHATVSEMESIFDEPRILNRNTSGTCQKELNTFDMCISTAELQTKNGFHINVEATLNQNLKADLLIVRINSRKHHVLIILNIRTEHEERVTMVTQKDETLKILLEI